MQCQDPPSVFGRIRLTPPDDTSVVNASVEDRDQIWASLTCLVVLESSHLCGAVSSGVEEVKVRPVCLLCAQERVRRRLNMLPTMSM
eukprot:5977011-Amphidinium_carterae.4